MGDFIEDYMNYTDEFTDAPQEIQRDMSLMLISLALNRNVWIQQGAKRLHPNLWMMVVAPSSFYRKSYSLGIAERFASRLNPKYKMANEFSREKFLDILDDNPVRLIFAYEFRTLISMMNRDYMAGTQSMLTEMFDCPETYTRETKGGSKTISNIFLNLAAATTMDWLESSIKDGDIAGGFLPRFLICPATNKSKTIAWQKPHSQQKFDLLLSKLIRFNTTMKGSFSIENSAITRYEEWYWDFERKFKSVSARFSPFFVRLMEYCKKFSMILAANNHGSMQIRRNDMDEACRLTNDFSERLAKNFMGNISFNRQERNRKKVLQIIKSNGNVKRRELMRLTNLSKWEMDNVIADLLDAELIEKSQNTEQSTGRSWSGFKATI